MTLRYVDSNAVGLNDGTSWTDAYSDFAACIAGSLVAGDTIHGAHNHNKGYTVATTLTFPDDGWVIFDITSVGSRMESY
mgnify:CR=1 FL=1